MSWIGWTVAATALGDNQMSFTRRKFVLGMGTVIFFTGSASSLLANTRQEKEVRYAMIHDESRCNGCNICARACRKTNHVPAQGSRLSIPRSVQGPRPQQVPHGQVASRPGSDGTPAGCQQPVNRPQTIQFHQPVQMPQSQVYDGQWLQPVPSQPQTASTQTVPDNKGESEYGARAQDMGQYGFDKDDEHDRELLREDPYAEYLDFPEEYRMKDEAQMEMICC